MLSASIISNYLIIFRAFLKMWGTRLTPSIYFLGYFFYFSEDFEGICHQVSGLSSLLLFYQ